MEAEYPKSLETVKYSKSFPSGVSIYDKNKIIILIIKKINEQ